MITTTAVITFILCLLPTKIYGIACTSNQLKGDFNSFRTTGGGGTYAPGSNQIVSYDHPTGSPVIGITGISVVANPGGTLYLPVINSGVPVTFVVNGPDVGGSINLRLPTNLPSGSFMYRLSLTTTTGSCTFDSIPFTSTGTSAINQCNIGQSQCVSSTSYQNCVSTPNGNIFGGILQICTGATTCKQVGSLAVCSLGNPSTCTLGNFRCSGSGFQQCYQGANGPTWTTTLSCASGTQCQLQGNSIICIPSGKPADECTPNTKRCLSSSQYQTCLLGPLGNYVWGNNTSCAVPTVCTGNGTCSLSTPNDCTPGYMTCVSNTTWKSCSENVSGKWQYGSQVFYCAPGTKCTPYLTNYIICT